MTATNSNSGFTLIELVAVIVIMAILAAVVGPRFGSQPIAQVQTARDEVVASLQVARQLALARGHSSNPIVFQATSSSVSITESGSAVLFGAYQYPLSLPSGVSLTPVTNLSYNQLGETSSTVFTLSSGDVSATVTVESTGYAH